MLSKELQILKQIEELYGGDIDDEKFLELCKGKESKLSAWKEAFKDYPLFEITRAINHFYVKKSSKTRPNISQITAILQENNATIESKPSVEVSKPDLDRAYMHEDVEAGNCHYNLYYYTAALIKIRNNEYPMLRDVVNPTKGELTEVMEDLCLKRIGKKIEFLSKNDLIAQGYDMNKRYSVADLMKTMFEGA